MASHRWQCLAIFVHHTEVLKRLYANLHSRWLPSLDFLQTMQTRDGADVNFLARNRFGIRAPALKHFCSQAVTPTPAL